jgi:hypothetical protein
MGSNAGERRSPVLMIFGTTTLLLVVSLALWLTNSPAARGAAISLVGIATIHLVKETTEILRSWEKDK